MERLPIIDGMHRWITAALPSYDDITRRVLDLVEESMLVPVEHRVPAWKIREQLGLIIEASAPGATTPEPRSPAGSPTPGPRSLAAVLAPAPPMFGIEGPGDIVKPSPQQPVAPSPSPSPIASPPVVTTPPRQTPKRPSAQPLAITQPDRVGIFSFQEASKYIKDKKAGNPIHRRIQSVVQQLKDNLGGRDQLFFVDTSESMAEHRDSVTETLRVYAYMAKLMDTNGIEAGFSNQPKPRPFGTTTALLEALKKQRWNATVFENSFGTFINSVIKNLPSRIQLPVFGRTKQQSIFVLTDGRWGSGDSDACGVDRPIMRLIDAMKIKGLDRTHVAIQFIRFGADEQGMRRLDILDQLGSPWDM